MIRTRKGRLENKIADEMARTKPSIKVILSAVDSYEKDNIDTIEKLKRDKKIELNRINGALKQTINSHGPITKELIGSASKRIHGALLTNDEKPSFNRISVRDLLFGLVIGTAICLIINAMF